MRSCGRPGPLANKEPKGHSGSPASSRRPSFLSSLSPRDRPACFLSSLTTCYFQLRLSPPLKQCGTEDSFIASGLPFHTNCHLWSAHPVLSGVLYCVIFNSTFTTVLRWCGCMPSHRWGTGALRRTQVMKMCFNCIQFYDLSPIPEKSNTLCLSDITHKKNHKKGAVPNAAAGFLTGKYNDHKGVNTGSLRLNEAFWVR